MSETSPTPRDARALVDEAKHHAATVRRSDSQLRWILLLVATTYLVTAALLSFNPRQGNVLIGRGLAITFLAALAGSVYVGWRIRAWSRSGLLWFVWSVAAFLVWNGAVIEASIASGWWGPTVTAPGIHFAVSALVAVIPLFVAAWLMGRR